MWFRNLQIYRLEDDWKMAPGSLEAVLASHRLQPCGPLAWSSRGWVAPGDSGALVESVDRHLLLALGVEQKLLPASVIADRARTFAQEWERSHGVKPGRKLKREFKDRAATELLPRALTRRRTLRAWIDPTRRRLVCDSASPAAAELATEALRDDLDELNLSLPTAQRAPDDTLSAWLRSGSAGPGFILGDECELTGSDETRPILRYQRHPLPTPELRQHLDSGFRASRLGLVWRDRLSFVVDAKLQLKKLRFLDIDESDKATESPEAERFAAELALMTGTCTAMIDELFAAMDVDTSATPPGEMRPRSQDALEAPGVGTR
ncbi:MAG TPA: recombination-associated protein RdgC [Nevskiaceae bacterium]